MRRRGISLLLAFALTLSQCPLFVLAQELGETEQTVVEDAAEATDCQHEEVEILCEPLEDWHHAVIELCVCGEETDNYEEICQDEDGDDFCDLCEAELPCLHAETAVAYEPGPKAQTHFAITLCACGEEVDAVMEPCADEDSDGLCDGCEAELEKPIILGDVDGDGAITDADAKCILYYVVGIVDAIDVDMADVDGDGMITAMDATCILRYCENLIDAFPAEA